MSLTRQKPGLDKVSSIAQLSNQTYKTLIFIEFDLDYLLIKIMVDKSI